MAPKDRDSDRDDGTDPPPMPPGDDPRSGDEIKGLLGGGGRAKRRDPRSNRPTNKR